MTTIRRLPRVRRQGRSPRWLLTVPSHVTQEQAVAIRKAWQQAGREGVAVIGPDIRVTRLGR